VGGRARRIGERTSAANARREGKEKRDGKAKDIQRRAEQRKG